METVVENDGIINREVKYDGKFKVEEVTVKVGDKEFKKEVITNKNSVGALVFNTSTQKYLFVEQFRAAAGDKMVEIIAGKIEDGEKVEEAVKREIVEEIGYKVDKMEHITDFYILPGNLTEVMALFYVEVSEKVGDGGGIEDESIKIVEVDSISTNGTIFMGSKSHSEEGKILNKDYFTYKLIDAKSILACSVFESANVLNKIGKMVIEEKMKIIA